MEEFKMKESDDDQLDLLGEGSMSDLKNALSGMAGFGGGAGSRGAGGDDLMQFRNNTVIAPGEYQDEQPNPRDKIPEYNDSSEEEQ